MIYMDNAATTKVYGECNDIIRLYNEELYYNPSALYGMASKAAAAVEEARGKIAHCLGCDSSEVLFTASGSEADNIALTCSLRRKGGDIIISSTEHAAIYNTAKELENRGYRLIILPTDRHGRVDIASLESALSKDTRLVSVMHVSNDTGALNDIAQIAYLTRKLAPTALIHSDGVQALGKVYTDVRELGVDMYSVSGHKVHGPKGVGALYVSKRVHLSPFVYGGGQEKGVRSATENVAGICAFAYAAGVKCGQLDTKNKDIRAIRDALASKIGQSVQDIVINTDIDNSAPHILSIAVAGVRGEVLAHCLEDRGIIAGTGSACSARKADRRIAGALALDDKYAGGILRLSLSEYNTVQEADAVACAIKEETENLRRYIKR